MRVVLGGGGIGCGEMGKDERRGEGFEQKKVWLVSWWFNLRMLLDLSI